MVKSIVVLSDIQVGHKLSICSDSPSFPQESPAEPTIYTPNKVQKALFKAWQEVVDEWEKPDVLIINGEPIEGQQNKNMGVEVWTTDLNSQLEDAQRRVEMFKAKKMVPKEDLDILPRWRVDDLEVTWD